MPIDISARFAFHLDQPTDVLLQFEAAAIPTQNILRSNVIMSDALHSARVPAHGDIGERLWLHAEGNFAVNYAVSVEVTRATPEIKTLAALDPHRLPGEVVEYLFGSYYCQPERLQNFVASDFGELRGGALVSAMRDWVNRNIAYEPGSSNSGTNALDSFVERRGVCRDFAHVLITLARCAAIPARYVSCYAPGVSPPDFHAVAEVFLADPARPGVGAWYIVDGTGMADPAKTVTIGIGRDAADVSFMTSFGPARFDMSEVSVRETG